MRVPFNIKLNIFVVLGVMALSILVIILAMLAGAFGIALTSLCGLLATGSILFVGHWFDLK